MSDFLKLNDIKDICSEYTKAHLTYDEPIPSFDTRYPEKLETAIQSPQKTVDGKNILRKKYPAIP